MGFSRQEHWSGLPCPPPGDLPNPGIKPTSPVSPALQADSFPLSQGSPQSRVQLFATLWTVACQARLFMGFSRQEYWSELPHPPPGDLPDPGIKPASLVSPALAGGFFTTSAPWEGLKREAGGKKTSSLSH